MTTVRDTKQAEISCTSSLGPRRLFVNNEGAVNAQYQATVLSG
jgi:hypothetical protein